jgi:hypothetical protein
MDWLTFMVQNQDLRSEYALVLLSHTERTAKTH